MLICANKLQNLLRSKNHQINTTKNHIYDKSSIILKLSRIAIYFVI